MSLKRYLAERWYINHSHDKDVDYQDFDDLGPAIAWLAKMPYCTGEYDRCVVERDNGLKRVWPEPGDSVRAKASEELHMPDRPLTGASAALFQCLRPSDPNEQVANLDRLESVVVACGNGSCQRVYFSDNDNDGDVHG